MSFLFDLEYKYIHKADFNPNILLLAKLYAPLISRPAFCLYVYMCEELKNFNSTKFFKNYIKDIQDYLELDNQGFEEVKNNLEAFKLLKTYITDDNIVYFELIEPLQFNQLIQNKKYKINLEAKLGKKGFDKLVVQYSNVEYHQTLQELTINQDDYFQKANLKNDLSFDFEKLYANLALTTKLSVFISDDVKKEIEYYFQNYQLSFLEIEKCVYDSIIKVDQKFEINLNLIQVALEALVDKSAINLKEVVKRNLSYKHFIQKFSIQDLQTIFINYQSLKAEQFLTSLTCEDLTANDLTIIKNLRNRYQIAEPLINIMIDFSIRKTHNSLNAKYLYKMAKSFNLQEINSLELAYEFLFDWDKKVFNKPNQKSNKLDSNNINIIKQEVKNHNPIDLVDENDNSNDDKLTLIDFEL
ncbi:MAG: DnaD domain protein [Malacoplasma sp.]|nr:DnaD domain protein [Malacoplasma sp.]